MSVVVVRTVEELEERLGEPSGLVQRKQVHALDPTAAAFVVPRRGDTQPDRRPPADAAPSLGTILRAHASLPRSEADLDAWAAQADRELW